MTVAQDTLWGLAPTPRSVPPHPAKFSAPILTRLAQLLNTEPKPLLVLDPFAGVGGVHTLAGYGIETVGVEMEREWAQAHPRTLVGDARQLAFANATFSALVSSPTYGNRMADNFEASKPEGRHTYRQKLGHPLRLGNSGAMKWGEQYHQLHREAWAEAHRVLRPGALALVNVKDHLPAGQLVPVVDWHRDTLERLGFLIEGMDQVPVRGMRYGANSSVRVAFEVIIRARKDKH